MTVFHAHLLMLTNIALYSWILKSCCTLHLDSVRLLAGWEKALDFIAKFFSDLYALYVCLQNKVDIAYENVTLE